MKRFDRDMMQAFYRDVYTPENLVITAAGNLKHDDLVRLARERSPNRCRPGGPVPANPRPPRTRASCCATRRSWSRCT